VKNLIRSIWTIFTVVVLTVLFASLSVLFGIFDRRGRIVNFFARSWAKLILAVNGVTVHCRGCGDLPRNRSYVFMANHTSALDIPVLFAALPFQLRMMAKKELFRFPIFGWALAIGGYIKVDRENREKAIASLQAAASRVVRHNVSVVVFPEGTRSSSGELGRFKKGGFMFALDAGYPIVPITIKRSRDRTPNRQMVIYPGSVDVVVDEPIPVEGVTPETRDHLIERTFLTIQANQA